LTPFCTARTPARIAARDATAVMVKDRCMVNRRDLAQQGARRTGENMRSTDITAMSKGAISYILQISYSINRPFPDTFFKTDTKHIYWVSSREASHMIKKLNVFI
jgi:hypothetical protein